MRATLRLYADAFGGRVRRVGNPLERHEVRLRGLLLPAVASQERSAARTSALRLSTYTVFRTRLCVPDGLPSGARRISAPNLGDSRPPARTSGTQSSAPAAPARARALSTASSDDGCSASEPRCVPLDDSASCRDAGYGEGRARFEELEDAAAHGLPGAARPRVGSVGRIDWICRKFPTCQAGPEREEPSRRPVQRGGGYACALALHTSPPMTQLAILLLRSWG